MRGLLLGHRMRLQRRRSAPLDALRASIYAAYGLRRLVSTWSGPLVTVRRSTDNATLDVYPAGDGWLDTAALLAWCGSASAYVTRWWDQSGLARNAEQATASSQPRIVLSGVMDTFGGKPAIYNSTGKFFTSSIPILSQPSTYLMTFMCPDYTSESDMTIIRGSWALIIYISSSGRLSLWSASGYAISSDLLSDAVPYFCGSVVNGPNSIIYVNNSVITGDLGVNGLADKPYIFANKSTTGKEFIGYIGDLILLSSSIPASYMLNIRAALSAPRGIS